METAVQGAVKMPIRTVEIKLDEIGYKGWVAVMRLNPRSSKYDHFIQTGEFGSLVISWNFGDEEGNPLPIPKEGEGEGEGASDIPWDARNFLVRHYIDAFNEAAGIPKVLKEDSNGSLQTKEESQATGKV